MFTLRETEEGFEVRTEYHAAYASVNGEVFVVGCDGLALNIDGIEYDGTLGSGAKMIRTWAAGVPDGSSAVIRRVAGKFDTWNGESEPRPLWAKHFRPRSPFIYRTTIERIMESPNTGVRCVSFRNTLHVCILTLEDGRSAYISPARSILFRHCDCARSTEGAVYGMTGASLSWAIIDIPGAPMPDVPDIAGTSPKGLLVEDGVVLRLRDKAKPAYLVFGENPKPERKSARKKADSDMTEGEDSGIDDCED